ncbi:uncharacterized protein [Montipora foliosa]|uniref:uncharacterized protein isoform X1 n=1 Tax=Montipora foliosa TaxID=591990 RepID=UPI0035F183B5
MEDGKAEVDRREVTYGKVGCFKDNQADPRPLPELLEDLTGEIDWYDLDKVKQKCATLAKLKGYTYFGMQSLGQCRSGQHSESTYNQDGKSYGCQKGLGGEGENMVFALVSASQPVTTPPVGNSVATTQPQELSSDLRETTTSPPTTKITTYSTECMNYKLLNDANRAEGYSSKNRRALCDKELPIDWYRFTGEAGDKVPDFCVAKLRCGTHAPGWLNNSHPSVADGIINAKICFHWGSNCCLYSTKVRVRNCGKFFVYQLNPVPVCSLRYCGNNKYVPVLTTPHAVTPSNVFVKECFAYQTLSEVDRSQSYMYKSVQGAKPTCDRWLANDWYRFTGLAGDRMPDKCVPVRRCGTLAPGWLSGGHPKVADGAVSRLVCFNWALDCCTWRSSILVRNCGGFYVYKLKNAPVCKLRYCGVGGHRESTKTTRPTTTTSTTIRPTTTRPTKTRPTTTRPTTTRPTTTSATHPTVSSGFVILCLPAGIHVHIKRQSLPRYVDASFLRLDDPRCGVVRVDDDEVMLATPLNSCGTMRRTENDHVSFQNKVVAEFGEGNKRSHAEFPFRCTYKKFISLKQMVDLQPLFTQGQVMDSTLEKEEQTDEFFSQE